MKNKKIRYTILGLTFILLIIGAYFYGYQQSESNFKEKECTEKTTDSNITLISVPVANKEITGSTQITANDIEWIDVSEELLEDLNIITSYSELIDMYVNNSSYITQGSFFYTSQIVTKSELPNSVFDDIPYGYTLYALSVDYNSTYGNSFCTNDIIDIYVSVTDEYNIVSFGKLFENVEILAVRNSSNEDINSSSNQSDVALILFALPDEAYNLLIRSTYIDTLEIIPVPVNSSFYSDEFTISSEIIYSMINSYTVAVD